MTTFVELDVRPTLRAGGEPFGRIMATVSGLKADEGLRLFATFLPTPLLHVLGAKGFTHKARELGEGEWEVEFTPPGEQPRPGMAGTAADDSTWPEAVRLMDNRDLDPPEPMERILAAVETMAPGQVLSALLCREPIFLFPALAKRGHAWRGDFEADGKTYKILIRIGAGPEAGA